MRTVPLLHIGDVPAPAVRTARLNRIGLLGTAFTMEQPVLVDRLAVEAAVAAALDDDPA